MHHKEMLKKVTSGEIVSINRTKTEIVEKNLRKEDIWPVHGT